jgi:hypothetical protein
MELAAVLDAAGQKYDLYFILSLSYNGRAAIAQ